MVDKLIVTNKSALIKKYGNQGLPSIEQALSILISADKQKGLETKVIYIDSQDDMKQFGNTRVENALDAQSNKEAIDAVYHFFEPDYLVILGAPDVIPYQDIRNPVLGSNGD